MVPEAAEADISKFTLNGEWELVGVPCERNEIKYVCCDAPYPDITYTVKIRRRTLFFLFNMVIPCLVIVGKDIIYVFRVFLTTATFYLLLENNYKSDRSASSIG